MSDLYLNDMDILYLYNLSVASKYGIPDQGSPAAYARLAGMNLAEKFGNGYKMTMLGLETLKINKEKLFGKKKRVKKPKFDEELDYLED